MKWSDFFKFDDAVTASCMSWLTVERISKFSNIKLSKHCKMIIGQESRLFSSINVFDHVWPHHMCHLPVLIKSDVDLNFFCVDFVLLWIKLRWGFCYKLKFWGDLELITKTIRIPLLFKTLWRSLDSTIYFVSYGVGVFPIV